jgi:hypothetical protein
MLHANRLLIPLVPASGPVCCSASRRLHINTSANPSARRPDFKAAGRVGSVVSVPDRSSRETDPRRRLTDDGDERPGSSGEICAYCSHLSILSFIHEPFGGLPIGPFLSTPSLFSKSVHLGGATSGAAPLDMQPWCPTPKSSTSKPYQSTSQQWPGKASVCKQSGRAREASRARGRFLAISSSVELSHLQLKTIGFPANEPQLCPSREAFSLENTFGRYRET